MAVQVCDGTHRGISFQGYAGADERLSQVIGDGTRDDPVLGQGGATSDNQSQNQRGNARQELLQLVTHKV